MMEAERKIAEAHATRATRLDLSSDHFDRSEGLTELPAEIVQLTNLTDLRLGGNQLTALPAEIAQLTNLTSLRLDNNPLPQGLLAAVETSGVVGLRAWFEQEHEASEVEPDAPLELPEGASMTQVTPTLASRPFTDEVRIGLKRELEPIYHQAQQLLNAGEFDHDDAIIERVEGDLAGLRVQLWPKDGQELKSRTRAVDYGDELLGFITAHRRSGLKSEDPEHADLDKADELIADVASFNGTDADVTTAQGLAERLAETATWDAEPDWLADEAAFEDYSEQLSAALGESRFNALKAEARARFSKAESVSAALYADAKVSWLEYSIWATTRPAEAVANVLQWTQSGKPATRRFLANYVPLTAGGAAIGAALGNASNFARGGVTGMVIGFVVAVLTYGFTTPDLEDTDNENTEPK